MLGSVELVSKSIVKKGNNAGDVFYKLQIGSKNYNVFKDSPAFEILSEDKVNSGDEVEFEFSESLPYEYQGKQVTSKHLTKLEVVTPLLRESKTKSYVAYREYQMKLFEECAADASEVASTEAFVHIAIAFFEKRCSPLHYFEQEGK